MPDTETTDAPPAEDTAPRPVGYRVELPDGTVRVATNIRVKIPATTVEIDPAQIGRPGQELHGGWTARFTSKLDFDGDDVLIPLTSLRVAVSGLVAPKAADPTLFDAEREERRHQYRFEISDGVYMLECSCGEWSAEALEESEAHVKGRRHVRLAVLGHKPFTELAEGMEGYTVGCMCGWRAEGVATDEEQAGMWIERHLEEAKDEPLPAPPRAGEDQEGEQPHEAVAREIAEAWADDDTDPGLD